MKISKSLNMNYKKAFSLLEIILSIAILAVVIVGTLTLQSKLLEDDKQKREEEILKLDLLSSKIYLERNLKNIDELKLEEKNLLFKENIFLQNVSYFEKNSDENFFYIKIILDEKIENFWIIKK